MKIFFVAVSSFVIGIITGSFIYFNYYQPEFLEDGGINNSSSNEEISSQSNIDNTFLITAVAYGGCVRISGCSSYRINGDGSFVYSGTKVKEGELTGQLRQDIINSFNTATLNRMAKSIDSAVCSSFVDGVDYHYRIEFGGREYEFDTCTTEFDSESELGELLTGFWVVLSK